MQFHIWMCGISAEFSFLLHMWDIYKLSTFEWKYLCNSQNGNVIPKHTKPKQTSITVKTSYKFFSMVQLIQTLNWEIIHLGVTDTILNDNKNLNWGALNDSYTVNASTNDWTHKTLHGLSVTKVPSPSTCELWSHLIVLQRHQTSVLMKSSKSLLISMDYLFSVTD